MKNSIVFLARALFVGVVALFALRSTIQTSKAAAGIPAQVAGSGQENPAEKSSGSTRKDLEAMYTIQDEAIKRCDFKAFISTLAPDYSIKLLNGDVFNRQQVEGFVKTDMARTKSVEKSLSSIDSLSTANNKAVVIVTHEASRVLEDAHGQPHKWENKVVHKETWIKTADGWRIQRLEELKQVYVLRDGKTFHP